MYSNVIQVYSSTCVCACVCACAGVCVWVGVCGLWTRTYDDMTATYTDQYTANSAQKIH